MSTQDKLVEALRVAREWLNSDKWRNSTIDKHKSWEALMRGIDAALAEYDAHADEAAQAQASVADGFIAERVNVGRGDERYIGTAEGTLGVTVRYGDPGEVRNDLLWLIADAMLAAAPRQAAEPVAYTWSKTPDKDGVFRKIALYTHPAPAQDAKDAARYRWLRDSADSYTWDYLGGIGADRVDAAVDAAMAKESVR